MEEAVVVTGVVAASAVVTAEVFMAVAWVASTAAAWAVEVSMADFAEAERVSRAADFEALGFRRDFGGYGGYSYGGYGDDGYGLAGGLLAGSLIGGGLGYDYGGYGPGYDDNSYAYTAGPATADSGYCIQRYKSYDPASGTYLGYDGQRHPCP
jgi:BA14K-like protein